MVITAKGQVTIPQEMRNQTGLLPGTEVEFVVDGDGVRLRKVADRPGRGSRLVALLVGRAATQLSTDEIMAHTRGED